MDVASSAAGLLAALREEFAQEVRMRQTQAAQQEASQRKNLGTHLAIRKALCPLLMTWQEQDQSRSQCLHVSLRADLKIRGFGFLAL